ncbi:hypothetical protein ACXWRW_09550, partial [Streptococcus pyogenes]
AIALQRAVIVFFLAICPGLHIASFLPLSPSSFFFSFSSFFLSLFPFLFFLLFFFFSPLPSPPFFPFSFSPPPSPLFPSLLLPFSPLPPLLSSLLLSPSFLSFLL